MTDRLRDIHGRYDLDRFATVDRRWLIRGLAGSGLVMAGGLAPSLAQAQAVFFNDPFTLGVASGDPAPDGFVIWTKIAPEPLQPHYGMPGKAVEVTWQVAKDERMREVVAKGTATARPELGHSVHVEVGGLEPGREYFYRFGVGGERSRIGRSKTLPAPGATSDIRFASVACQRYEHGFFAAYHDIAGAQPDFVFHAGDYIYEYRGVKRSLDPERYAREMPGLPQECFSLADYRLRYAIYKLDPHLQAAHAATPFLHSFDDHEVENDWTKELSEKGDTPPEVFLLRRAAAWQAWYENLPVRKAQMPRGPDIQMYRRFDIGGLIRFNVLDTRQFRTGHFCKGKQTDTCAIGPAEEQQTMLGDRQEAWLAEGLKDTSRPWTVLAQQILMMQMHNDGKPDKWDRVPAARKRLFDALEGTKGTLPVTLTGDVHYAAAGELRRDFGSTAGAALGVEFVSTSIASHASGRNSTKWMNETLAGQPYVKHISLKRGWTQHHVSAKQWRAEFRTVDDPADPDSDTAQEKMFVVEAGKAAVQAG